MDQQLSFPAFNERLPYPHDPRYTVESSGIVRRGFHILKPTRLKNGYLQLTISGRKKYLHRVMAETFLSDGKIPDNLEPDHLNKIRTDNQLNNLELVTHAENCRRRSAIKRPE